MVLLRFPTATRMGHIFFSDEAHIHIGGYTAMSATQDKCIIKPKVTVLLVVSSSATI